MARRRSRPSRLEGLTAGAIRRELRRRERRAATLFRRRERLAARVRAIDDEIARLGVSRTSGKSAAPPRFRNERSLADALVAVLDGRTLSIAEAMQAVQKAGYRTTAQNFRVMVNLALTRDKRFKRIERGRYTAR